MSECIETDVLILGCGVAGGTVALCLADAGMPVTLVTRAADPNDSNTNLAQGGITYAQFNRRRLELAEGLYWSI